MQTHELATEVTRLRILASSENWHEREDAGFRLRNLMEQNFEPVIALTEDWLSDKDERVRRAVCLSCMQRKAYSDENRIRRVLHRLESLMVDDALYVRKCCGPFVVGYLGYTYPNLTIPWLAEQSGHPDINVRSNVAKAFSQALGAHHSSEGLEILATIADDGRRRVRSATVSALRNIIRRAKLLPSDVTDKYPEMAPLLAAPM